MFDLSFYGDSAFANKSIFRPTEHALQSQSTIRCVDFDDGINNLPALTDSMGENVWA